MWLTIGLWQRFWIQHPALLYAIAFLLGSAFAFLKDWILLFPMVCLLLPFVIYSNFIRSLFVLLLLITSYGFITLSYQYPKVPSEGIKGKALLEFDSIALTSTHFGKNWLYKGIIHRFDSNDCRIPFCLNIPYNDEIKRPSTDHLYEVEGRLKESSGHYRFSVGKHTPWYPLETRWNLIEKRFLAKQAAALYIQKRIPNPTASSFLIGIATGDFDDRFMKYQLNRFGLQHIMAISGFHFAIVTACLGFLLRACFGYKWSHLLLIILLTIYFLFLGATSSVMRAWLTILVFLGGHILQRHSSGLNSLGVALLCVLIYDPEQCRNLGFQFSFAVTAAILLFYHPSNFMLKIALPSRSLSEVVEMNRINQHGYCVLTLFRQALALGIAVNLVAIPLSLYHFHKFPWWGIIYNLFFPFLVSISISLLCLGVLAECLLAPLGQMIHFFNGLYTKKILNFVFSMPISADVVFYTTQISLTILIILITCLFLIGIYVQQIPSDESNIPVPLPC